MMTIDEFIDLIGAVTYKPGWKIETHRFSSGIVGIMIERVDADSNTGEPKKMGTSFVVTPEIMENERHALEVIRGFLHDVELHESDEWLRFRDARVRGPHGREI